MTKKIDFKEIRNIRRASGLNQFEFWTRYGTTQSGGSRYETGRDIPTAGKMLMWLHLTGVIDDKQLADARKAATR